MRKLQTSHAWLRILRDVLLVDLFLLLAVGIVYRIAGWESVHQYGSGLVWASAIGVLFLLVSAGWRDGRRQELVALSQIMREQEVFYLLNRDNSGRARFMLIGLIGLILSLAVGLILLRVP